MWPLRQYSLCSSCSWKPTSCHKNNRRRKSVIISHNTIIARYYVVTHSYRLHSIFTAEDNSELTTNSVHYGSSYWALHEGGLLKENRIWGRGGGDRNNQLDFGGLLGDFGGGRGKQLDVKTVDSGGSAFLLMLTVNNPPPPIWKIKTRGGGYCTVHTRLRNSATKRCVSWHPRCRHTLQCAKVLKQLYGTLNQRHCVPAQRCYIHSFSTSTGWHTANYTIRHRFPLTVPVLWGFKQLSRWSAEFGSGSHNNMTLRYCEWKKTYSSRTAINQPHSSRTAINQTLTEKQNRIGKGKRVD